MQRVFQISWGFFRDLFSPGTPTQDLSGFQQLPNFRQLNLPVSSGQNTHTPTAVTTEADGSPNLFLQRWQLVQAKILSSVRAPRLLSGLNRVPKLCDSKKTRNVNKIGSAGDLTYLNGNGARLGKIIQLMGDGMLGNKPDF